MNTTGLLMAACFLFAMPTAANGPITVGETRITNDYPEAVTFEIEAASTAAAIISIEFNLAVRGNRSTYTEPAEFAPGDEVIARYVWTTRRDGIPPGTPLQYSWTIYDEAGNTFTTEPAEHIVSDPRFNWQKLENDALALWWYDGDGEFGQRVFAAADRALAAMRQHAGQPLPHRVHVVLYGNDADFHAWHSYAREWVGGEAYPAMGLTVQIVPPPNSQRFDPWINQLISHEIAHLFFFQITDTPLAAAPPSWLAEGFVQYHELGSKIVDLASVRIAAQRGKLIPLRLLSGTFTGDEERINLMYAESLSAVTFITDQWGDEGMARLLQAYGAGYDTDGALLEAIGMNFEEFQQAWWEWLGGQPGAYPTRPPQAGMPTVPPLSSPRSIPSPGARPPAELLPAPTGTAAASLAPSEQPVTATPPAATPRGQPTATQPPTAEATGSHARELPCAGALGLLVVVLVLGQRRSARKAENGG